MPASSSKASVGKRQQAPSRDVLVIVGNLIKQVLRGQTNKRQADAVRPTELLRNLGLVGSQCRSDIEEDAHEFLRQLLQSMADSCLARSKFKLAAFSSKAKNSLLDETTAIHRIFGGYLRSRLKCRSCGHQSDRYEQFMDLSMELPSGVTTVEGALEAFTSVEHLEGSNRWCCNVCEKLVEADKNLTIFKPSNALVVHLKRFAVQGQKLTKMKTKIGFGESLAVKVSGPEGRAVYDLTGVVQHSGEDQRSGHYVALVKTSQGKWCQADDARVFEVGRQQVGSAQPYVLFYTRRRPALALVAPSPPALPPPTVLGGSGRTSSGEDLQRVAFQKELQAGLSQNQAAVESKDKWSRSASFWDRSLDMGKPKKMKDKKATTPKLGENAFQSKQEERNSKSRRGYPEALPHKMAPTNDENQRVTSGEGHKRNRGGSGGELKMGRGGAKARRKKGRRKR